MTDIVERLREKRGILDNKWPGPTLLEVEAADEIERLRGLLARWHNIASSGQYGEKTKWPLRKHPLVAETRAALSSTDGNPTGNIEGGA